MIHSLVKYVLFATIVAMHVNAFAVLDPPIIRCVSIDQDNNVSLTWEVPVDSNNEFTEYQIYYRTDASGVFNQIQQIGNYNQTNVQLTGPFVGGDFYMVSVSNGGTEISANSNTVQPIILDLTKDNREVTLTWSEINLPSQDSLYRIFRSVDGSDWNRIKMIDWTNQSLKDTVQKCEAQVKYRIEIRGLGGCFSRSNEDSLRIKDEEAPLRTNLVLASVDTSNGTVDLQWEKSKSSDTYGCIINYFEDFTHGDTVFGPQNLSYNYFEKGINGLLQPETLSVAPFDSCFDSSNTLWYNQAADSLRFATLFIDTIAYDRCAGKIGLTWNMPTPNNPVGVRNLSGFNIYRKDGASAMRRIGSVTENDSVFLDSGLIKGEFYEYMVTAKDESLKLEALSNVFKFRVRPPKTPKRLYISSIVNDHESERNQIHVLTDTISEATRYGLFRSLNYYGSYQLVANSTEVDEQLFIITDPTGEAKRGDFYYTVQAFDVCDDSMAVSLPAKSIYLNGYRNEQEYFNELDWSEYFGFENAGSSVGEYQVVRVTNGSSLDTIFSSRNRFGIRDTIYELKNINGEVCYYTQAIESDINQFDLKEVSISNQHCESYGPKVFIPNTFSPDGDGINDVWLPNVNYVEVDGYSLAIFDRAGQLIYTTTDSSKGWDGSDQPIAVYAYFLQMQNSRGEAVNYSGSIHLIRQ